MSRFARRWPLVIGEIGITVYLRRIDGTRSILRQAWSDVRVLDGIDNLLASYMGDNKGDGCFIEQTLPSQEVLRMPTLRALRVERLLTQEQLAAAAEVSTSTVYNAEAGKVHPRPSIVRRMARALGVAPTDIEFSAGTSPRTEEK